MEKTPGAGYGANHDSNPAERRFHSEPCDLPHQANCEGKTRAVTCGGR
jgi:hypothetical protein